MRARHSQGFAREPPHMHTPRRLAPRRSSAGNVRGLACSASGAARARAARCRGHAAGWPRSGCIAGRLAGGNPPPVAARQRPLRVRCVVCATEARCDECTIAGNVSHRSTLWCKQRPKRGCPIEPSAALLDFHRTGGQNEGLRWRYSLLKSLAFPCDSSRMALRSLTTS